MGLRKIKTRYSLIEFHNDWKGVETVFANKQVVAKKFVFKGADHAFKIYEQGIAQNYILTSKIGVFGQKVIDLRRNGMLLKNNLWVIFGTKKIEPNKFKIDGLKELKEYDTIEALELLTKGIAFDRSDPEIYFHMACCHSINENLSEGFECLRLAVAHKYNNHDAILEHDMLSFIRTHNGFEDFKKSKFTKYDKSLFTS